MFLPKMLNKGILEKSLIWAISQKSKKHFIWSYDCIPKITPFYWKTNFEKFRKNSKLKILRNSFRHTLELPLFWHKPLQAPSVLPVCVFSVSFFRNFFSFNFFTGKKWLRKKLKSAHFPNGPISARLSSLDRWVIDSCVRNWFSENFFSLFSEKLFPSESRMKLLNLSEWVIASWLGKCFC